MLGFLQTTATSQDVHASQLDNILRQREQEIEEINRQTVPSLHSLLERAVASKNKLVEIKIRQTLVDLGHPHPDDWLLGT